MSERRRWRKPNTEALGDVLECHSSLRAAVHKAGGAGVSIEVEELKNMSALDLLTLIGPNGIRFCNRPE